jgi:spermidine/putrescine transport system ATP-binding protein
MALADHCVVMNEGRIEDEGRPEMVYARPATRFSATFMGESTLLSGEVIDSSAGAVMVRTSLGDFSIPGHSGVSPVGLAIRPEHLRVGSDGHGLPLGSALVTDVVFQGSFRRVLAVSQADPQIRFIARVPAAMAIAPDESVEISCRPEDVILLER